MIFQSFRHALDKAEVMARATAQEWVVVKLGSYWAYFSEEHARSVGLSPAVIVHWDGTAVFTDYLGDP